jgi:hypothetical protein
MARLKSAMASPGAGRRSRTCAPTATRTRDLPLRRSFRGVRTTAALVIRASFLVVLMPLDVRGLRHVLARGWHGLRLSQSADFRDEAGMSWRADAMKSRSESDAGTPPQWSRPSIKLCHGGLLARSQRRSICSSSASVSGSRSSPSVSIQRCVFRRLPARTGSVKCRRSRSQRDAKRS